ncbi:MAG: GDSL-type esterase/lipase family protein [Cyclobacteriaceae bacterium]
MKKVGYWILTCLVWVACQTDRNEFYRSGRSILRASGDIELISSGASVEFLFTGDSAIVSLSGLAGLNDHNYIVAELDGQYSGRFKITSSDPASFVFKAVSETKLHELKIIRATEASNGVVVFHGARAEKIFMSEIKQALRVEFIGNSITAAMGADTTEISCGGGSKWYDQHNAYFSYAAMTARALNAEYMLSAISGAGVYRNWNSDGPAVPQQYESAYLRADSTLRWNFDSWKPDIVTIALGTNDMSPGDGKKPRAAFDSVRFISAYTDFIRVIHSYYPKSQIVLLTSPMMSGKRAHTLLSCLQQVRLQCINKKITAVPLRIFEFREMKATGCTGHPLTSEHRVMADQLTSFLRLVIDGKI